MRKAKSKAKAQHMTGIIPSKLIAALQHSARLGKTLPVGWLGGEKLRKRVISVSWS